MPLKCSLVGGSYGLSEETEPYTSLCPKIFENPSGWPCLEHRPGTSKTAGLTILQTLESQGCRDI